MKRFSVVIFLLLFVPVFSQGEIITGGVEYSLESAREEAFTGSASDYDGGFVRANLTDRLYRENLSRLLNGNTELTDRILAKFSDGTYGLIYKNRPQTVLYYSGEGVLLYYEERTSTDYPYKSRKYSAAGKPVNVTLKVSKDESYIFDFSQKLLGHWVGGNCYDAHGNIIRQREIYE